ncbi:MAG TPA: ABC transporter substrate-binding protein, partial [Thermosynechococcaceae cyanobacterium]
MAQYSRRNFLTLAGTVTASSVFLKGCLGNPPDTRSGSSSSSVATQVANVKPGQEPETDTAKLGYIPIVEAAPLIIAKEKGFFAKYGMKNLEISKQANWGAARDNVKIGSAGGGIDGGQWQMPMPYLINEGLITDGKKIPMYIVAQLNTQGNGIALANKHKGKNIGLNLSQAGTLFSQLKSEGSRFKAAYTFPKANQEFWIRYWLAAGG